MKKKIKRAAAWIIIFAVAGVLALDHFLKRAMDWFIIVVGVVIGAYLAKIVVYGLVLVPK